LNGLKQKYGKREEEVPYPPEGGKEPPTPEGEFCK